MKVCRVFPADIMSYRPYRNADWVDRYYADMANKAISLLEKSPVGSYFGEDSRLLCKAGMYFSMWFEDICSETGIWRTVNAECSKRYGMLLPFYDMSGYYEGEVNVQDTAFLLWHFMQTFGKDGILINPENPGIAETALALAELFDSEYETAPGNIRLHDFVHNLAVTGDWWRCRDLIEWFLLSSYVFVDSRNVLEDKVEEYADIQMSEDKMVYMLASSQMFESRRNILSLSVPEWLSAITGNVIFKDLERLPPSYYLYKGMEGTQFFLYDMVEEKEYALGIDSLAGGKKDIERCRKDDTVLFTTILRVGSKYYISGIMTEIGGKKTVENSVREEKERRTLKAGQKEVYRDFMNASGGSPVLIVKGVSELKKFFSDALGISLDGKGFPLKNKEGCYVLYGDPVDGVCISPDNAECIAQPDNPVYNKEKARTEAVSFYCNSGALPYRAACFLHDSDLLPDAAVKSLKGYEYGRDFLHRNGNFFLDYFYHSTRKNDFNV